MSRIEEGWSAAVSAWADAQDDIKALVQIGSRVQAAGSADRWSDYDYQIITSRPEKYRDGSFARELGASWVSGAQISFGDAVKVTAVYEGAMEVDFVVLRHVEVLIATLALRWPSTARWWPRPLSAGVKNLRIVAAPGWKVIKGGAPWHERYSRISAISVPLTEREFTALCDEFWIQVVWAAKKACRGESLASQRAIHLSLVEASLRLFQEEAILDGRRAHPLGRRAENWLTPRQLQALAGGTKPDRASLMAALAEVSQEFAASAARVAGRKQWRPRDYGDVRGWLSSVSG
jgi:hypothetical protein